MLLRGRSLSDGHMRKRSRFTPGILNISETFFFFKQYLFQPRLSHSRGSSTSKTTAVSGEFGPVLTSWFWGLIPSLGACFRHNLFLVEPSASAEK